MSPAKIALKALHRHFTVFHRYYRTACDKGTVRSIHQLRTNARRFRNALKTYSLLFDKAAVKRFNRLLQMTAREASQLRDLDVYLFFLQDYKSKLRSDVQRQSIRDLLADLRRQRAALQPAVSRALRKYAARLSADKVVGVLERKMKKADAEVAHTMMDIFHRRVEKSTHHLLAYNVIVPYPEKKTELHEMRKCAKHLRYTLEGIRPYFDVRLELYIGRVYFFHKILGDIHDCDVWLDMLSRYRAAYKMNSDMGNSLNVLYNYLKKVRDSRYRIFVQRWHRALQSRHFEEMLEFVYAHH
ncbi:MAG: CHAD domain-containing protein [Candidatus Omnitrophica bacterium]|nr:CHAD domain-containing protein [Candidatus Omnitrophota bacterium]